MEPKVICNTSASLDALEHCFPLFAQLRPHLTLEQFIAGVTLQLEEGYRIVYLAEDETAVAAAGFRLAHFLAWGKVLYIDDLITDANSCRRGHGSALMRWLEEYARESRCEQIHLDSGYQRHTAHRLYLNNGFDISSHHFSKKIL